MSRIGRMPVTIPAGVEVSIAEPNVVTVKGPKGTLTQTMRPEMIIKVEGNVIHVGRPSEDKLHKSLHGLTRSLIHDMVVGVTDGFKKELEINGVGYKASKEGNKLVMNLGYSHLVTMEEIDGITIDVPTRSSSTASISRRSASLQRTSEARDLPSLTRARASSTPLRPFATKRARPAVRSN